MTRNAAFTLLELLIVVTLMMAAVGMTVFRLDGLSDTSRLRSAAMQMASLLRLTQTQARTSGSPRLVEYAIDSDRVLVRAPQMQDDVWEWDAGVEYLTVTGVHVQRVLVEGAGEETEPDKKFSIRVRPDGRYRAHAIVLMLHDRWAVAVARDLAEPRCLLLDSEPHATTFELLMLELERPDDAG